jgi:hypothetical protein
MRSQAAGLLHLFQIKHRSKGESFSTGGGESDQFDLGIAERASDGAVRSTEVNTDCRGLMSLGHSVYYSARASNRVDETTESPLPQDLASEEEHTKIIGNFRMTYQDHSIDCDGFPWYARIFTKPHIEIENDPRVWDQVASLIESEVSGGHSPLEASLLGSTPVAW